MAKKRARPEEPKPQNDNAAENAKPAANPAAQPSIALGAAFSDMQALSASTKNVLSSLGFERATPVQEAVIPLFCGNKDVAVDACTGSGKTLAFVVPVVERLARLEERLKKHQVGAIIISPTRELAAQISRVLQPFAAAASGITTQLLVGGTDPAQDVATFKERGAQIFVGTPGRIDDVLKRCTLVDLRRLEVLVLDEADRLLDMGFRGQLDAIMARLPKQRRTGLFSATQTEAVEALARAGLRNPVRVNVAVTASAPSSKSAKAQAAAAAAAGSADGGAAAGGGGGEQKTPTSLQIQYVVLEADQKLSQLVRFLQLHADQKTIVYFLTCGCVDFMAAALKALGPKHLPGLQVKALHGRMKQAAREATLASYTALPAGCLLCTDVAARGLDIPDVHWIVQYDPPQDPAAFVHRVGRTARMGRSGNALVYLHPNESPYVDFLALRRVPLGRAEPLVDAPDVIPALRKASETDREVMEAGSRAFISFVRGYKEHHCKYIFRLPELDLGRTAMAFAMLRLPRKVPELRKAVGLEHFVASEVDPDSVKFKDKGREKQRQQLLKQRAEKAAAEKAVTKQAARTKRGKESEQQQQHQSGERLTAAKRRKLQQRDERAELFNEYTLLKKLKKGKISEHQFDVATGLSSGSDDDMGAPDDDRMGDRSDGDDDRDGGDAGGNKQKAAAAGGAAKRGQAAQQQGGKRQQAAGGGGAGSKAQQGGQQGQQQGGALLQQHLKAKLKKKARKLKAKAKKEQAGQ